MRAAREAPANLILDVAQALARAHAGSWIIDDENNVLPRACPASASAAAALFRSRASGGKRRGGHPRPPPTRGFAVGTARPHAGSACERHSLTAESARTGVRPAWCARGAPAESAGRGWESPQKSARGIRCSGRAYRSCAGASSIMRPRYKTRTRSAKFAHSLEGCGLDEKPSATPCVIFDSAEERNDLRLNRMHRARSPPHRTPEASDAGSWRGRWRLFDTGRRSTRADSAARDPAQAELAQEIEHRALPLARRQIAAMHAQRLGDDFLDLHCADRG